MFKFVKPNDKYMFYINSLITEQEHKYTVFKYHDSEYYYLKMLIE